MTDLAIPRRALLAGAAILAAPRLGRAADPTGDITVVGYFGIFEDHYTRTVINPFMQRNPGIKVTFRPVRGSADVTALLRTGRNRPTFDIAIMDLAIAAANNRDGLFAALDPAVVTNLADLPDWGRPEGNLGAALTQDVLVMLYAPKRVTKVPASWADLADPAYRGRAGMPIGDVRGTVLLALLNRMANTDYRTSVDPGLAMLKRIAANVQTYEPQPDIYTAIRSGLIDIGIGWNARGQANQDDSNGEFACIVPIEGTAPQVNTINLVNRAPNPDAAQAFINHALSAEAQKAFAASLFYGPTNSKAELAPPLAARIFGSPEVRAKQMDLDWPWFTRNNNALIQRIRREVIAG
ncbi:extracellular solute-binding protein [Humitalea sp. 24SJ18S-53]|uniref:extracellular solute-binding protein n=1 Tax=Humitalea sp. 24SJ18S-53 TaxID=3422307 RepID=UPI003D6685DD